MVKLKVDAQGRLVLPQAHRRRLGIHGEVGVVELSATPEGVVIEPSREVKVSVGEDGLAVATIEGVGTIRNLTVLEAIQAGRAEP